APPTTSTLSLHDALPISFSLIAARGAFSLSSGFGCRISFGGGHRLIKSACGGFSLCQRFFGLFESLRFGLSLSANFEGLLNDKGQNYFGHPRRLPRASTLKYHGFHLAAAQRLRALLSDHPTDRVRDVTVVNENMARDEIVCAGHAQVVNPLILWFDLFNADNLIPANV